MLKEVTAIKDNYKLTKLLNRVQVLSTAKKYAYNKMDGINSKPDLQQGNENLLEYSVNLPLHIYFCDIEESISIIEDAAKSRTSFDWVYQGSYMGQFVIDSVEKTIQNRAGSIVIYAELTFNLLEVPADGLFREQIAENADISGVEKYSETSNKVKSFVKKAKEIIVSDIKESISNGVVSDNLPDAAKELASNAAGAILRDINNGSITDIYSKTRQIVSNITTSGNINLTDIKLAAEVISDIPKNVIKTALRRGN